jgi:hypothetical protein
MGVSVLILTRDHGVSLGRAIDSVRGFAAEVVVADTGSTDDTVAVAAARGAKLVPVAWADDFAAALNAGLAAAGHDWVFALNPDEEVAAGADQLVAAAGRPAVFGVRVPVAEQPAADDRATTPPTWELRLFRNDPRARYRGRVHPALHPSADELAGLRGEMIATADAPVRKHAYLSVPTPEKLRWVVRLLEAELRERPAQLRLRIELGRNLLLLREPSGHDVLAGAAELVQAQADAPTAPDPAVAQLLEYLLGVSPDVRTGPIGRGEARVLAEKWFPRSPPVLYAAATERFRAGDHAAAAGLLERLVGLGRTRAFDPSGGRFSPDILGPAAVSNLGLCYLHLGRWEEAKTCFGPLVAFPRYRDAAAKGYAMAEQQRRPKS